MTRSLLVLFLVLPMSAEAGKYMMGDPPSSGWDWVGRAVEDGVDLGPEVGVLGVTDTRGNSDLAFEAGLHFGIHRPTRSWFARPGLELNASVVAPVSFDWFQVRVGVGTNVGPIAFAMAWVQDIVETGTADAISPELRVRHRFGAGLEKPSISWFARMDFIVNPEPAQSLRFAIGMTGAIDLF